MATNSGRYAIAIMAKAPRPGRSKTRLCPPLTHDQAATLSAAFVQDMWHTLGQASRMRPIDPFVAFAPAGTETALRTLLGADARLLLADGEAIDDPGVEGFGRPLLQTMRALLALGYRGVCLLNSDSPTLPAAALTAACDQLDAGAGAVLGPAADGGYYLLGLPRERPALFADIAWSTGQVAGQTRQQARRAGLDMIELQPWYDVDDAASLARLLTELDRAAAPDLACRTRAALSELGVRDQLDSVP